MRTNHVIALRAAHRVELSAENKGSNLGKYYTVRERRKTNYGGRLLAWRERCKTIFIRANRLQKTCISETELYGTQTMA